MTPTRVTLLHGFTQTGACWAPVDDLLRAHGRAVVAPDLAGHGSSTEVTADLWGTARQIAAGLEQQGGEATSVIGYSLGGRVALHLALERPDLVATLVLVGATPGIEDGQDRAARRAADETLAARVEAIGVSAFLDEWLAQPLFVTLDPSRANRLERERNTAAGLAASLRTCGTGTQEPLWDRLGDLQCPVLAVTGEQDTKFGAVADRMATAIGPTCTHVILPGAGHAVHLEQPERFAEIVSEWLDDPQTGP
ncbi:MAG: 2-succinyl-6-hydroxy-2,4-cyclohexadiene-1-carboxylate synthase [Acidimicrobiia bacterium]|nr:2-succinyl-6-hydroxy-2,4-cyclohexadiene-1-carboxylate synthase [Acidimicrobiia bacterium]